LLVFLLWKVRPRYENKVTLRPDKRETLQNAPFCPISASGSNFNPRNTQCIPVVKIIAFLELEQKLTFFKGLNGFEWRLKLSPPLAACLTRTLC
jgi:hypothetical protein